MASTFATRPPRNTVTASSVDLSDLVTQSSWDNPRSQKAWQREIYRLLELVGELRSAAKLIGTAVSKSRLYIADVDEDGEIIGETESQKAQRICNRILGGGDRREEEMRLGGQNLFLVGECYLWGRTAQDLKERDRWHTLSVNSFSRAGGKLTVDIGERKRSDILSGDILRRVWMPHPEKRDQADSGPRSCRAILQELEQLTKFVFTQIDSRLISAGILPWPNPSMASGAENVVGTSIMKQIVELSAKANNGTGTAAASVPLIVDVPPEALGKINLVSFQSELSRVANELRTEAINRLAMSLDIAPEQLTGTGDTNHWSVWYIDESAVKVHVEPILYALCEAIQAAWVDPALKASGLDQTKYRLTYDTSTLTVRPQRLKETLDLYVQGLVSAKAVLDAGAYRPGDAPDEKEATRWFLRNLCDKYPQLLDQPEMREAMGLGPDQIKAAPVSKELPGAPASTLPAPLPPAPPPPPAAPKPGRGQLPLIPNTANKPGGNPAPGNTVTASANVTPGPNLLLLADACAQRALELAGGRLLTRANRHQYEQVPRDRLHTRLWVDPAKVPSLTAGASEHAEKLAIRWGVPDSARFAATVGAYCDMTLRAGAEHDLGRLAAALQLGGFDVA